MFRVSADLPPINSAQLKSLLDNSSIQSMASQQDTESSEISPKMDDAKSKFISPYYSAPSERVAYIFTGNFEDLIKSLLNEPKEDGNTQGDEAEAINYYKNWLVLKELMEQMDNCASQPKFLILGVASSWLGAGIALSRFPISQVSGTILASLSFAILTYVSFRLQRLAQRKENDLAQGKKAVESKISAFEAKYEFVTEHRAAKDWRHDSRLETRIVERKNLSRMPNSFSALNFSNQESLLFTS